MKKYLSIIVLIVLILGSIYFFSKSLTNLDCKDIDCIDMKSISQYKIEQVYQDDPHLHKALYSDSKSKLRLTVNSNISLQGAEERVSSQFTKIKAFYEDAPAPYPGEISDVIECGEKYEPMFGNIKIDDIYVEYATGYYNERLVFGACSDDQVEYWGILLMFYCPDIEKLFQLEILFNKDYSADDKENYVNLLSTIKCRG